MADKHKKYRERRRIAERCYELDVGFFSGNELRPERYIDDEVLDQYAYPVTYTPSYFNLTTGKRVTKEPRTFMSTHGVQHDVMADITQEEYYGLEEKAREESIRRYYKDDGLSKNHGRSEKEYRKVYNRRRRRKNKQLCHEYLYEGATERAYRLEGEVKECGYGIDWDMW